MRKQLRDFDDIHHHCVYPALNFDDTRVVNLNYNETVPDQGYYSIGLHPWSTENMSTDEVDRAIATLESKAINCDRIVAIGECGIDHLRGGDTAIQTYAFSRQAELAEKLGLPLIIHSVKAIDEIIRLKKQLRPTSLWIIHGFRGKPELARQITGQGIALSLGERFNSKVIDAVAPEFLFHETDEAE